MGHWEWEKGEFKLPSAEFGRVRKLVEDADMGHKKKAFDLTQEFWKGLTAKQKRDIPAFRDAAAEYTKKLRGWGEVPALGRIDWRAPAKQELSSGLVDLVEWKLPGGWNTPPKRVLVADMEYPSNRTTSFRGNNVTITFDKATNSVEYDIDDNRHTIDNAHSSPVFIALSKAIEDMRWTRGTGGRTWSDNEYAAEARHENGHDSSMTDSGYGPIGAENWPMQTRTWKDPKGDSYHAKTVNGKFGMTGRVTKGVPAGGQFTSRYRPDSSVSLNPWR